MKVVLKKEVCGPINSARVLLKNHHSHKKSKTRFKRKKHRRKHGKSCIQTGTDWKKILLILRVRFGSAFCVSQIRLRFCLCFCFCFFFFNSQKVWLSNEFSATCESRILFTNHSTIYTFKNYFVTVFFNFQFLTVSKRTLTRKRLNSIFGQNR